MQCHQTLYIAHIVHYHLSHCCCISILSLQISLHFESRCRAFDIGHGGKSLNDRQIFHEEFTFKLPLMTIVFRLQFISVKNKAANCKTLQRKSKFAARSNGKFRVLDKIFLGNFPENSS